MTDVDDRKPVSEMTDRALGVLIRDKGYISGPLWRELANKGVILITGIKKNMKTKVMKLWNRLVLRKRFVIDTVFDQLKTYPKSSILGTVVVSDL
ncbi:hypothetical protein BTN49_0818 [Candidatus Enterovibrio escicola]|uniref:Transposase DDE domain-containing protein n=1 Tax=Candidatus Enterovibrio escicola TaxID=1927127 RepID=A0A2A5T6S2_9GAMM|nr:hypothetical protein BTN49_0818 [Candidatus Enterovibrio escacola]